MLAHQGLPLAPHDLWRGWTVHLPVVALIAVAAGVYELGLRDAGRRGGLGVTGRLRAMCYFGGLGVVALALVSPLDALSGVLFSAHMVQHLLLTLVAAPLLVFARPGRVLARALPRRGRRIQGRLHFVLYVASRRRVPWLVAAWVLSTAAFWVWHVPVLYEAALAGSLVHGLEHATMFTTALLFWWAVGDVGRRAAPAHAVVAVFLASLAAGALGALLTLSPRPWYDLPGRVETWGLSPLEDQQLAGVIMWMPGGLVYLAAAVALCAVWLTNSERSRSRPLKAALPTPLAVAPAHAPPTGG